MDGINYEVLHNIPIKYHLLLLDIINELYNFDVYPNDWKNSFIHFVEKPNSSSLRPIALTSCICKIFELMISNRLRWWIESNKLLPNNQTGFRKSLSCIDNLASLKLDIEDALSKQEQIHAAFIDVSDAFNNVQSHILLTKLAKFGCSTKILKFTKFLTYERYIFTDVNSEQTTFSYKGVPQGGVLSPIFYIIYVADLFNNTVNVNVRQYADDVVVYSRTRDIESG
ncbi:hypothetical protein KPH14_012990, partial [Odynerus spinipes]